LSILSENEINDLIELGDPFEQLDALSGRAQGKDVFILSCGPSLSEYTADQLREYLSGSYVMVVKQAYDVAPDLADFHILNTWNSQRYDYSAHRPFIIREGAPGDPPVFGESDLNLVVNKPSALSEQLARKQNFGDFAFSRSLDRPWGPGVLYEIGFYLAEHLGARRVITLGWDVGMKNSSVMPHFYDKPDRHRTAILAVAEKMLTYAERNRYLHENGVLYNKPRIIPDEVEACISASEGWNRYLSAAGIELIVVSSASLVSETIPRARLEDLV
jgi:hypothetical protein